MQVTRRNAIKLMAASALLPSVNNLSEAQRSSGNNWGTYKDPSLPIERRVQDLLVRMAVEEKARQLDM